MKIPLMPRDDATPKTKMWQPAGFDPAPLNVHSSGCADADAGNRTRSWMRTRELAALTEYANRFHHDTNLAWGTEEINDAELRSFVERALALARR